MITSAYKCLYRKRLISSSSMFEVESCCDVLCQDLWCMRKVRGSLATALESLKFVLDCLKIVGSPGGDRCWPKSKGCFGSGDQWLVTCCDCFERQGHTWSYFYCCSVLSSCKICLGCQPLERLCDVFEDARSVSRLHKHGVKIRTLQTVCIRHTKGNSPGLWCPYISTG